MKNCVAFVVVALLCLSLGVEAFKKGDKGKSKVLADKRNQPIRKPEDIKVEVVVC